MHAKLIHPNNAKILEIWENDTANLSTGLRDNIDIRVSRNLFLIGQDSTQDWTFHYLGQTLRALIASPNYSTHFSNLWDDGDNDLVKSVLKTLTEKHNTAIIRTTAQSNYSERLAAEILFLPVNNAPKASPRILGVYQPMADDLKHLKGYFTHNIIEFFFSPKPIYQTTPTLVVNNTALH